MHQEIAGRVQAKAETSRIKPEEPRGEDDKCIQDCASWRRHRPAESESTGLRLQYWCSRASKSASYQSEQPKTGPLQRAISSKKISELHRLLQQEGGDDDFRRGQEGSSQSRTQQTAGRCSAGTPAGLAAERPSSSETSAPHDNESSE
jgi:hypothetical protein